MKSLTQIIEEGWKMPKVQQFKIGDRVKIVDLGVGNNMVENATGIVRKIKNDTVVGIKFEKNIQGHNLGGAIVGDRGWYVLSVYVKLESKQLELAFD
jgi:hypothetical protein